MNPFTSAEGSELIKRLETVTIEEEQQDRFVEIVKGHPLCLKSALIYMKQNTHLNYDIDKLTGNLEICKLFTEDELLYKIIAQLSEKQKYFLKMISISQRSITEEDFRIVIDSSNFHTYLISSEIINPLQNMNLIEKFKDIDNKIYYSVNPLLKIAFSKWMDRNEKIKNNNIWAGFIKKKLNIEKLLNNASDLYDLQPLLDILNHYFEAENYKDAWDIFFKKKLSQRLFDLGYFYYVINIGKRFENVIEPNKLKINDRDITNFYNIISQAFYMINEYLDAINYRKKQLEISEKNRNERIIFENKILLAEIYLMLGYVKEAEKLIKQSEKNLSIENLPTEVTELYERNLSILEFNKGNYQKALEIHQKSKSSNKFNRILVDCYCAEAYIRLSKFDQAYEILDKISKDIDDDDNNIILSKNDTANNKFISLKMNILTLYIYLYLKKSKKKEAREKNDQLIKLNSSNSFSYQYDKFLLIEEGKIDIAIREAKKYISSKGDEKINKRDEITALLILSTAFIKKNDKTKANKYFDDATNLMEKTGCELENDRLNKIKKKLK